MEHDVSLFMTKMFDQFRENFLVRNTEQYSVQCVATYTAVDVPVILFLLLWTFNLKGFQKYFGNLWNFYLNARK